VFVLLAIAFVLFPLIEIAVLVFVGQQIGALNTIGVLVLVSLVGAWLARHEGFFVLRRIREQLDAGRVPADELLDGALVLAGGMLLLLPGFVSDAIGLLVLFPPTRAFLRRLVRRRMAIFTVARVDQWSVRRDREPPDDVIDV
jgi:UPF0716 protein FxsA